MTVLIKISCIHCHRRRPESGLLCDACLSRLGEAFRAGTLDEEGKHAWARHAAAAAARLRVSKMTPHEREVVGARLGEARQKAWNRWRRKRGRKHIECKQAGCNRHVVARGRCRRHYERLRG